MTEIEERDLWWEARQQAVEEVDIEPEMVYGLMSYAAGEGRAIVADLNLYRPNVDLKALLDRGVTHFILRMGGPRSWVQGAWNYQEDPTWRPYYDQLKRLGVDPSRQVIGYIIHNPFESWSVNGATGETVHTELIDEWTSGGYMPAAFCYDHEVAMCWRGGVEITQTAPNLVTSLRENTLNTYRKFRRTVGLYYGRWFININGLLEHVTWLDNVNKPKDQGGEGMQRPTWNAWVPQPKLGEQVYQNAIDLVNQLLVPNSTQINNFLQCGSYSLYTLWQFLFSFRTPEMVAAKQSGIDISISRGTIKEFEEAWGLTPATGDPEPEPDNPPQPDTQYVSRKEFEELKAAFENHTHGKPV